MDLIRQHSNPEGAVQLTEKLDNLLTDYEIYHRNLRRIHWDQSLRPFIDFSSKLDQLYHIADNSKNEIAENLLSLGGTPDLKNIEVAHLLPQTRVNALTEVRNFETAVNSIMQNSAQLLEEVKEVFLLAAHLGEQRTQQLMVGLSQQLTFTVAIFNGVRMAQFN
jgi:starvation-inducible DNA-binding protein